MDVPYAATPVGGTIFVFVMIIFLVQEFTNGWDTPTDAQDRDEKWALLYLDALPVLLVSLAAAFCLLDYGSFSYSRSVFAAGVPLFLAGIAVRHWSMRTLGRFHQARVTIQADHETITEGPYRLVRHPMYSGAALAFLGVGLALGTWPGLLLVFFGTLFAILRRIQVEERALLSGIGDSYAQYASGRARLVPGIW